MISIILQPSHNSFADIICIVICVQSQMFQKLNRTAVDFRDVNAKHHIILLLTRRPFQYLYSVAISAQ